MTSSPMNSPRDQSDSTNDRAGIEDVAARTVYFDHAATSWPKPPEVVDAVRQALTLYGGNPGRGAYALGLATSRMIFDSRRACADLLGVAESRDLAFVSGCTEALNVALKGILKPGDRVVASAVEHNAVARPLAWLAAHGVDVVYVPADASGYVDSDTIARAVAEGPTRAVVCQHASNVTGTIQPIADIIDVAHEAGALAIVDGAQAGGHLEVDLSALGADAYAVSGHKGLLGPQGVGLLYLAPDLEVEELMQGGTGAGASEKPEQPRTRPDRYEAGTPNTPGIAGLGAAARLLSERGPELRADEQRLTRRLHEGVLEIGGYRVLGPPPDEPRVPLIAITHECVDSDQLAFGLDRRYGIAVRAGLHCAPAAHGATGTLDTGAVRFGLGWGTTDAAVDLALEALRELAHA